VSIPSCLLLLPLYSMSLQKNAVIRGGNDTRVDERAYFQQLLFNMDIDEVRRDALLFVAVVISERAICASACKSAESCSMLVSGDVTLMVQLSFETYPCFLSMGSARRVLTISLLL
jgi:hypothetical protein